jgi:carbon-monoxide dehydrogenase medium subunit
MIPQSFEYTAPKTLSEALALIAKGGKPLAGGMSLIPMMKLRLAAPESLVDLGRIPDLAAIREEQGALHIGATATHYSIESSPAVRGKCPLLAEAASSIGDVQVRNMGTLGGSVAHADPSADYPAALQALEAIIVTSKSRQVSAADFFVDTFTTTLEPDELIVKVVVPVEGSGTGTSYKKLLQPASGFAIVGVAVRIAKSGGKISMARIGVTGLSNCSYRAVAAEQALEGTAGGAAEVKSASELVADVADANSDLHASANYRRHLATVYAARAISAALARTA